MKSAVVALAMLASACASTGGVPRPQPFPGAAPAASAPETPPLPAAPFVDTYALVGTALSFRGAPYRNGGSDPSGFDCSGFTQYVFAQYGVPLARAVRDQYQQGTSIEPGALSPGDLVFFATTDAAASHVAIVVGGDQFVHAPSSSGVVRVEHLKSSYWSRRYLGARRIGIDKPATRP